MDKRDIGAALDAIAGPLPAAGDLAALAASWEGLVGAGWDEPGPVDQGEVLDVLDERFDALEAAIAETPATSPAALRIKGRILRRAMAIGGTLGWTDAERAVAGSLVDDLEQLADEATPTGGNHAIR